jgi:hypothetical protein
MSGWHSWLVRKCTVATGGVEVQFQQAENCWPDMDRGEGQIF